jgi:hypothetical protein
VREWRGRRTPLDIVLERCLLRLRGKLDAYAGGTQFVASTISNS